jgi:hypothetical protein
VPHWTGVTDEAVVPCNGTGGWDPSAQSEGSKSEQARQCMDLQHCLHWLHLGPTHLLYCTGYTWGLLTCC